MQWYQECDILYPKKPFILMGNKSDTRLDKKRLLELEDIGQQPITELEGLNLYRELGAYSYIESSAYCNIGIRSPFQEAIEAMWPKINSNFEENYYEEQSRCCTIQ